MSEQDMLLSFLSEMVHNPSLPQAVKNMCSEPNYVFDTRFSVSPDKPGWYCVEFWKTLCIPSLIRTQLPKYRRVTEADAGESCSICLEELTPNTYKRNLHCNHLFHKKCIDAWLRQCTVSNMSCPMCRSIIPNDPIHVMTHTYPSRGIIHMESFIQSINANTATYENEEGIPTEFLEVVVNYLDPV